MATSNIPRQPLNTAIVNVSGNIVNNYIVLQSSGSISYQIRNDICFLRFRDVTFANVPAVDTIILTGLPKPSRTMLLSRRIMSTNDKGHTISIITNNDTEGAIKTNPSSDTTGIIHDFISYPVDKSWTP